MTQLNNNKASYFYLTGRDNFLIKFIIIYARYKSDNIYNVFALCIYAINAKKVYTETHKRELNERIIYTMERARVKGMTVPSGYPGEIASFCGSLYTYTLIFRIVGIYKRLYWRVNLARFVRGGGGGGRGDESRLYRYI